MDTSKTYIKMCEKARELREEHIYVEGDIRWNPITDYGCMCAACYPIFEARLIWLPKVEQLRQMTTRNLPHEPIYIDEFALTSPEQLWLAFVMKEKYQKTWNGSDWVKV